MKAFDLLTTLNPSLKELSETPYYKLSKTLIRVRVRNYLSQKEAANALGLSLDEYVSLEYFSEDIELEQYQNAINRLEQWLNEHRVKD